MKTIKATSVRAGDVIDGRRVAAVRGTKRQKARNGASGFGEPGAAPEIVITGHVVTILFEDDGPPKHAWPHAEFEVERGGAA
jgi:hypothetical protein